MIRVLDDRSGAPSNEVRGGLDELRPSGVVTLHDVPVPGATGRIDHLVVAPTGVWVIDVLTFGLEVRPENLGGRRNPDVRLYLGGRDRTSLLSDVQQQAEVVRRVVGREWREVPVQPMVCVVDAVWARFRKPFEVQGVQVLWPEAMTTAIGEPGPVEAESVEQIASGLAKVLQPA